MGGGAITAAQDLPAQRCLGTIEWPPSPAARVNRAQTGGDGGQAARIHWAQANPRRRGGGGERQRALGAHAAWGVPLPVGLVFPLPSLFCMHCARSAHCSGFCQWFPQGTGSPPPLHAVRWECTLLRGFPLLLLLACRFLSHPFSGMPCAGSARRRLPPPPFVRAQRAHSGCARPVL